MHTYLFINLCIYAVLNDLVKYARRVNYATVHAVEKKFMNFTRIRLLQQY